MPQVRVLAGLVFIAIVLTGLDARNIRLLGHDREEVRPILAQDSPDIRTPEYLKFLEDVRQHTAPGDSIALVVRMRHWDNGYAYAFYRASYVLAGRRVVPLVDPDDSLHRERFAEAKFLAVWGMEPPNGPFEWLWKSHDGAVYRIRH